MVQKEDECLEYFVERLLYNVQRAGHMNMGLDVLKIILLRGIRDDCLDMLNLLGKGGYLQGVFRENCGTV